MLFDVTCDSTILLVYTRSASLEAMSVDKLIYGKLTTATSIRLLHITPDAEETVIQTMLTEVPLTQARNFIAISYVWGPTFAAYTIRVNDHPFNVGKNLWCALRHLRKNKMSTVWVDAICIWQCRS